ncbi:MULTISPECIES: pirin family protein [Achromobacter]|uniref:Pirin family protein n=1 Tax=Achromobacter spanius TaxID=217203 RepID=A0ABY8GZF9_9BURK|nr:MULTISPECIES: pirin family protein [Achromobacter]WAI86009.1 pirin family protein [Achromobacter spanius]WEX96090.1 pirin family protein [Achromobacter sp. SS2-2022]WFP10191.1 pirin family protein [Achromobacter spanius]
MTASDAVFPSVPGARPGLWVATLMLEDCRGLMHRLGGNGEDHQLQAGDLLWTREDAGVMRARAPGEGASPSAELRLNGLRMVVGLHGESEPGAGPESESEPQALRATPALLRGWQMPVIQTDAGRIRVAAGSHAGSQSPLATPAPMTILDAWLRPGATQLVPLAPGWSAWVYAVSGELGVRARHRRIGAPPLPRQAGGDLDFAVLDAGSALVASSSVGDEEGVLVLMAGRVPAHFVLVGGISSAVGAVSVPPSAMSRRNGAKSVAA